MSRYAVISDVHGNLHALEAVLTRIGSLEVDGVLCLGDTVGYGPFPDACLDLIVKHCAVVICGNHDEAAVDPYTASQFNGAARAAIYWTREHLGPLHLNALVRMKPTALVGEEVMCVHACPVAGPTDYVHDKVIAAAAFQGVDRAVCLLGHTHVPMVFETASTCQTDALTAVELVAYLPSDGVQIAIQPEHRYICNPGSVGQPRDADPRASFAILDLQQRTFVVHRVQYDISAAQAATQRAGLPDILADRLAIGA